MSKDGRAFHLTTAMSSSDEFSLESSADESDCSTGDDTSMSEGESEEHARFFEVARSVVRNGVTALELSELGRLGVETSRLHGKVDYQLYDWMEGDAALDMSESEMCELFRLFELPRHRPYLKFLFGSKPLRGLAEGIIATGYLNVHRLLLPADVVFEQLLHRLASASNPTWTDVDILAVLSNTLC
jgi:hypothetical protein